MKWAEEDDRAVEREIDRGLTPWQIAKILAPILGRSLRAVDTRARKLMERMRRGA